MSNYYVTYALKQKDGRLGYGSATVTIAHMKSMVNVTDAKKMILKMPESTHLEDVIILNWKILEND